MFNIFYEMTSAIENTIMKLPNKPGVYRFLDKSGEVIYVGKAKELKKRVSSYFNKSNSGSAKLRVLVSKIHSISFVLVDSENDALLLENNLIKNLKPRYNILLKDDKTYPWVCIKKEPFPRLFKTRRLLNDGSQYFGPFTSGFYLKSMLDLIRQLFPLRTCTLNLTEESIKVKKFKACLEYQIGNCLAPCIGKQTERDYEGNINSIISILKGENTGVIREMSTAMLLHARKLEFEQAETLKRKIALLKSYQSKTTIVSPKLDNIDVFSVQSEGELLFVNYLKVKNGSIVQVHNLEARRGIDEADHEILGMAIVNIRQRFESNAKEIVVSHNPDFKLSGCKYFVPTRGDKLKLLDLSIRNCREFMLEVQTQKNNQLSSSPAQRILATMKKDLRMNSLPIHIECFDNSNLQGTDPVAACVVFQNAKPHKKEYRHYNVKTVEGADDFATMSEIVYRRYSRLVEEMQPIPQLIIIDGGKGQLSAAYHSLQKLNLQNVISIIGIAKKLEEIYFPGDPTPLHLDKRSETLKVIQHARNEAHRFGNTFHRAKRSKSIIKSQLLEIKGIGEKTRIKLFQHYNSIEEIKRASLHDIENIIGRAAAKRIEQYYEQRNQSKLSDR